MNHHVVLAEKASLAVKEETQQTKHHVVHGKTVLADELIEVNKEVQSAHHVVENALVIEEEATELLELLEIPEQTPVTAEPRVGAASCLLDQDMGRDPVAEVTTAFIASPSLLRPTETLCLFNAADVDRHGAALLGPDSRCRCPATGREAVGRELDNQNHVHRLLRLRVCPLV